MQGVDPVRIKFVSTPKCHENLENGKKPTIGDIGAGVGQFGAWLNSKVLMYI